MNKEERLIIRNRTSMDMLKVLGLAYQVLKQRPISYDEPHFWPVLRLELDTGEVAVCYAVQNKRSYSLTFYEEEEDA